MTAAAPETPLNGAAVGDVPPVESGPPTPSSVEPATPEGLLLKRLADLPIEKRSGGAITDADLAMVVGLDLARFGDLRAGLRALRVDLKTFDARVAAARPTPAPASKKRPPLRVVADGEGAPPDRDERPVILFEPDASHVAVVSGVAAVARRAPNLYQRDGMLVHVVGAPEPREHDRAPIAKDTPTIRAIQSATLWEMTALSSRWRKYDARSDGPVPVSPPPPVIAAMLSRGNYPGVRELTGILEAPAMLPSGEILFNGYDVETGFLCIPSGEFPPPFEDPNQDEARAALAELKEVFHDFPYADEASRMVPIAAAMTILARPAILGPVPGFFFDASMRGSGKSLQVDAISLITTGRAQPPINYPADAEELQKVMGALALLGPQVVNFDNVACAFGGGPIDLVLTADGKVRLRVLGKSETPAQTWKAVILATGNNFRPAGDIVRRVLVTRLESADENPEERPASAFKHPQLLDWIRADRPRLVRAALTVLRAFVHAKRPQGKVATWGRFEAWSRLVPPAIVYAGGADPMLARPVSRGDEDPEKAALAAILVNLPRLCHDGKGVTIKEIVHDLYPTGRDAPPSPQWDDMREALETLVPSRRGMPPDTSALGVKFRGMKGRPVGGMKLHSATAHGGAQRWSVVASDFKV